MTTNADGMSTLEALFWTKWRGIPGVPLLVKYHCFDSVRQWRFDFAHRASRVAVEMEDEIEKGLEKYNAATFQGWTIIRLNQRLTTYDTLIALKWLIESRSPKR